MNKYVVDGWKQVVLKNLCPVCVPCMKQQQQRDGDASWTKKQHTHLTVKLGKMLHATHWTKVVHF